MKGWVTQLAGAVLVIAFAVGIGGFILVLRSQQGGLASGMAAANVRRVTPADGTANVPLSGEIKVEYGTRPPIDPLIKLEPVAGAVLSNGHWDGSTYVIDYAGLRDSSLYHVELDQDSSSQKGEHKQIKLRWSFRTGSGLVTPTSASPSASTAPTGTPSVTPELVWYSSSSGLNAVDWSGKLTARMAWNGNLQSPDGRLIYGPGTPSTQIEDAKGNLVGNIADAYANLAPHMWSDDSRQFCAITYRSSAGTQSLVMLGLDRSIHSVGVISLPASPTQSLSLGLAACSGLTGRAIVVGSANGYIWSMAMISLTDGSVIYQRRYPNPVSQIIASHDGHYIAEQLPSAGTSTVHTFIRELPSGNQVAQLSGISVSGFSWDGSRLAGGFGTATQLTGAEVIQWQTNRVVWNQCLCVSPTQVHVLAEPFGTRVAVMATDNHQVGTLMIVGASGAPQPVPLGTTPAQPLF